MAPDDLAWRLLARSVNVWIGRGTMARRPVLAEVIKVLVLHHDGDDRPMVENPVLHGRLRLVHVAVVQQGRGRGNLEPRIGRGLPFEPRRLAILQGLLGPPMRGGAAAGRAGISE